MLQQVESLVFIDKILAKCHKAGIKALSKHDSILFRQCDRSMVAGIIIKTLNQIFGKFSYSLDIDGEVFDLKPKKKPRFMRQAFAYMHNLFSAANKANAPPAIDAQHMLDESKSMQNYTYKAVTKKAMQKHFAGRAFTPLRNPRLQKLRKMWYGVGE